MRKKLSLFMLMILLIVCASLLGGCSTSADFKTWQKDAPAKAALEKYVKEVTDKNGENYIPPEERIVVFDLDGTLYGEKAPYYAIWQTVVHRILHDPAYQAPDDVKAVAEEISKLTHDSTIPDYMELAEAQAEAKAFAGMTFPEYKEYVKKFLSTTDASGFENLKLADAFYQPMLELIAYLQANDFQVYICSGTDRFWVRAAIEDVINIPKSQVIGMDCTIVAKHQGDADGLDYHYASNDEALRGDELIVKNVKMNKVCQMAQEIGRQPVLAFGNSSGDFSMLAYVTNKNAHLSKGFMVIADDTEREYGNPEKAEKMKADCAENGWETISMKDDWITIYGENVKKAK